jgi:hypothetical protein
MFVDGLILRFGTNCSVGALWRRADRSQMVMPTASIQYLILYNINIDWQMATGRGWPAQHSCTPVMK